jgi:hypothetical protein
MPDIPRRLVEIVQQLKDGTQPRRASVRSVLKWFGAARRRAGVVAQIEEALRLAGLATEPHLAQADLDEPLRFFLRLSANEPASANEAIGTALEPIGVPAVVVAPGQAATFLPDGGAASVELASPDFLEPEADEAQPPSNTDDRPVSSQPHDWTLSTLRDKSDRGQLDLQPQYQREYIWSLRTELPSRLIESLLLEIPIPPIYFGKVASGRLEVIDGQQRLTTMINFVSNKFRLQRLQRMGSLNGKLFRDMTEEHQNKVLDAPIRSVVIDAGHNTELRYEIFERLNRGSMALNEQELRNCVFRGPFNDLLAQLELDPAGARSEERQRPSRGSSSGRSFCASSHSSIDSSSTREI